MQPTCANHCIFAGTVMVAPRVAKNGLCFRGWASIWKNCGQKPAGVQRKLAIFFGSENASKMQYRLNMLRQACNCYDLLNVHQMVTEYKVSQYFSPHLSLHFQCYAVLMPLRTVQSPLNLHFWGFCAVIQSGTTANDENPVSHLNDSIVWCQQKIGFSHW